MAQVSACARHSILMPSMVSGRLFLVASSFCLSPCVSLSSTSSLPTSTCTLTCTLSSMWTAPGWITAATSPNEDCRSLAIYTPPTPSAVKHVAIYSHKRKSSRDTRSVQEKHLANERIRLGQEVREFFQVRKEMAVQGEHEALSRSAEAEFHEEFLRSKGIRYSQRNI